MRAITACLGAILVLAALVIIPADGYAQTLTSIAVEPCLASTHTKWRITNDTGAPLVVTWHVHGGGVSGSETVGPEHTMAARFTNPHYFYVPVPQPVTLASSIGTKAGGGVGSALPAPATTCPGSITADSDPGGQGATVSWAIDWSGDDLACTHSSDDLFPMGTTTVTCTATTYSPLGTICQQATCSFDVTVTERIRLTITAEDRSKRFDGTPVTDGYTVTYEGFVTGDGPDSLDGVLTFVGPAVSALDPGSYSIIPGGLTSEKYDIRFARGKLRILPYYAVHPAVETVPFAPAYDDAMAGGGGALDDLTVRSTYEIGEPIHLLFTVTGFYDEQISDAIGTVLLLREEATTKDGGLWHAILVYMVYYDDEQGMYSLVIPTDEHHSGVYIIDITMNDGQHYRAVCEIVQPSASE